jgi:dihydroxy-acid dehydratase
VGEEGARGFAEGEHPRVAVVDSWTDATPCNLYLRRLADKVKDGVRVAGGTPVAIGSSIVCEPGPASSLIGRDVGADAVELAVRAAGCAGVVAVAGCGNALPAMAIALARLDLPGLILYGGSPEDAARLGVPACGEEATVTVMAIALQLLGLSPLGFGDIAAGDARKDIAAVRCGELALKLLARDRRPRQLLTRAAFENAVLGMAATVGGGGGVVHLLALAREAGVSLVLGDIDALAAQTPVLLDAGPDRFSPVDFDRCGGTRLLARRLMDLKLLRDAATVSGASLFEEARRADEMPGQVMVRAADQSLARTGSFAVLRGSLAPDGCVAAAVPEHPTFAGPARVFDTAEACLAAIEARQVRAGDVLVLRYQGPKGGPGLRQTQAISVALARAALESAAALVTDGRIGPRAAGPTVGQLTPEAFVGGPLAFVRDGDTISIDLDRRTLDVKEDLTARRFNDSWQKPAPRVPMGVQARYAAAVSSASEGAQAAGSLGLRPR